MEKKTCVSCKKEITNEAASVDFMCPNCKKVRIVRCGHCRQISAKYRCHECGFEGPN